MSAVWPSPFFTDLVGPAAPGVFDTEYPVNTEADPISMPVQPGLKIGSGLVVESPYGILANMWPGVNDTFYNRILIDPSLLEMGNLLTNQSRSITVWNGFLTTKQLNSFERINDPGIDVIEPVTPPYNMRPLEELVYVLTIGTDGPAVIDATYNWMIAGETYTAVVTGRRVVVWPYGPSWDTPVTETLQWLTNILRAYDGSEQRRALRTKARRSFSYQFKTMRDQSARMENLLWGWQNRVYALPVWTDKSKLTNDQSASLVIDVATDTFSFTAGGLAVIYQDSKLYEVVEILSVQPTSLTLVRESLMDWSKGTTVMPMLLGHLPTAVPTLRRSSQAVVGTLSFQCDPGVTDSYLPVAAAPTIYDGLEVITRQPNWAGGIDNTFEYLFDALDQQTGVLRWDTTEEFPRITRAYSWLLNGRTQIRNFRSMLGRLHGQQKALRIPSWHDDFKVTRVIGASDVGLYVADNEFRLMVGVDTTRDRLMIRMKNGATYYRRITGISTDEADVILTLDSALGVAYNVTDFKTVHLLMKSRLATDQIDIIWHTDRAATVDTTFTTIKD